MQTSQIKNVAGLMVVVGGKQDIPMQKDRQQNDVVFGIVASF